MLLMETCSVRCDRLVRTCEAGSAVRCRASQHFLPVCDNRCTGIIMLNRPALKFVSRLCFLVVAAIPALYTVGGLRCEAQENHASGSNIPIMEKGREPAPEFAPCEVLE